MPHFSVIMATRNRPALFAAALESVLMQTDADVEIIVIDDGSAPEHASAYREVLARAPNARQISLLGRPNGHGQSYVLNLGADLAAAPYLCFLDDDDVWTDRGHLARARQVIERANSPVDLYMVNQHAFIEGTRIERPFWLEPLGPLLAANDRKPDRDGAYDVTVQDLLRVLGFCHVNTLIVRRALFLEVKGMDESIRWECDHDLYLRLIDRASLMKFAPFVTSRHNVPDPAKSASMTTALSDVQRRLFQLRVFDRAALFAAHPAIRAHGRLHKGYTLKRIARLLAAEGQHEQAAFYAREALGATFGLKWAAYTAWRTIRAAAPARAAR